MPDEVPESDNRPGAEYVRKLLSNPKFQEGLARSNERLQKAADDWPEIQNAIDSQKERLSDLGFPQKGDWNASLIYVCKIIQVDPAGLSAEEIENEAEAWIDREKIRARIRDERFLSHASPAKEEPVEDGPSHTIADCFFWSGRRHSLSKTEWRLSLAIWQKAGVTFDHVGLEVWGEEKSSGTIKSAVSRLNAKMAEHGIPLQWVCRSERIYLDDNDPE